MEREKTSVCLFSQHLLFNLLLILLEASGVSGYLQNKRPPGNSETSNVIIQESGRSSTIFHSMEWVRKPLDLRHRGHSNWGHQLPCGAAFLKILEEVLQVGTAQPSQACCSCCWTTFKLVLYYIAKNFNWGEKKGGINFSPSPSYLLGFY